MPVNVENGRNLAGVVADLKEESKEFVSTRLAMLRSEMNNKVSVWKKAAPMIVVGALLLATAWLLLTGAIVAAIYVAFEGNPWAAALALIIVCVAYAMFGGISVLFAIRSLRETGVAPTRTLRVLKDDQIWISNEARAQL
jgi:hypothetical protein